MEFCSLYVNSATTGSNIDKNQIILKDGIVTDGETAVNLSDSPGKWTRISMALDLENGVYDLYADGILQQEKLNLNSNFNNLNIWRIFLTGTNGSTVCDSGTLEVDNIRAYDGIKPRDISGQPVSMFTIYSDIAAKSQLAGKTALSPYANVIYNGYEKQKLTTDCIINGDEALISVQDFETLFGVTPVVSDNTITAENAVFTLNLNTMQVSGKTITIDSAPKIVDGQVMLPVCAYGVNVLGDRFYDDKHGLFVVSQETVNDFDWQEVNQYLFFNRYSKSELTRRFKESLDGDLTKHPRLFADSEDFNVLREEVRTDEYKKSWYQEVISYANDYASKTAEFQDYDVSSGRLTDISGEALKECAYGGFAYQMTGEKKYAERVIKVMMKICSYPDWYPEHTLGVGQMAQAVAIGFDWCYDVMTDWQRQYIMERAKELGLGAGYDVYYGIATYNNKFWGKTDTNWGGVVNGGLIALAASIAEVDLDYAMQSMENSLRSMEYSIYAIAPDGAWHEGPSYWSYYFGQLAVGMAAYESVIGGVHEAINYKGMDGMLTFQEYVTDPVGKYNNYNDAVYGSVESIGRVYIASKLGLTGVMKRYAENMKAKYGESSTVPQIYGLLWYDTASTDADINFINELITGAYFRETEFISMRENWTDADALWVSATGGVSNSSHSHLDNGSFVMTLDGIRWAKDLGTESAYYSRTGGNGAVSAGYTNWHYYRRKAEGHNMVMINPDKNLEIDKDAFAKMQKPMRGNGIVYSYVDLSSSYADRVYSYLRGYMVSENCRAFTLRDEIELKSENSELYWFMHTDGTITIQNQTTALITQNKKTLKVQIIVDGDNCEYTLCTMPQKRLLDLGFEETANSGEKLTIKINASGRVSITAKMSMLDETPSQTPPENIPICLWSAEE